MQADDAGDLPFVVGEAPDDDELIGLRDVVVFGVVDELVETDLDGAKAGEGVYFDAALYEDAGDFAADVVL